MFVYAVDPAAVHELLIQSVKSTSSRESDDSYNKNHDRESDEEDEGEIVSDDEEMQVDGSSKPSLTIWYGVAKVIRHLSECACSIYLFFFWGGGHLWPAVFQFVTLRCCRSFSKCPCDWD